MKLAIDDHEIWGYIIIKSPKYGVTLLCALSNQKIKFDVSQALVITHSRTNMGSVG